MSPKTTSSKLKEVLRSSDIDMYILEYILLAMSHRAKIFQNGGSQAVRLPKDCRFEDQDEVLVYRDGDRVILMPADEWSETFLACLGQWDEDIERPKQKPISKVRDPFA